MIYIVPTKLLQKRGKGIRSM